MSNELDLLLEKVASDTLPSLLSVCRITVPSTQRHYVQGADNPKAKQVRERFVEDVLSAFKKGLDLKLDFVFGPIDTTGVDSFVPVDGQQRITTLWLLLRYATEYIQEEKTRANLLALLGRFSYEGRPYAKRFCQALTQVGCPRWTDSKKSERPSVTLFSEGVASHGWLEDATVAAMVNMLDTIHEKWEKSAVDGHAENFVVFLWKKVVFRVCTDHFSDDLYMKMNARGLALTQWENAKGEFAAWMSDSQIWNSKIEKASNAFFEKFNSNESNGREAEIHLPDDPFFALIGRIARYELHCANKEIPSSLQELTNVKVESDDLPFVPLTEFSGISDDKKVGMLSIFLRILDFTLSQPCEGVENPPWVKRGFLQTLFIPKNRDDADFSLMLYAYFKHLDTSVKLKTEDMTASLRLFWNVLQNVSYDETKPFDRVDQVVNYFIGPKITDGNLYLGIARELTQKGSDQYREEVAKMDFYKEGGETLSLLQSVEDRLNGRVRLAVLELSAGCCSTMDVAKRRLKSIANLFTRWDSKKHRAGVMQELVLSEPRYLKDEISWRIDDDNLRKMLTNRNDYVLQESLVDGLRDKCEECKFDPRGAWERDWRKNVLTFLNEDIFCADGYNAVISEDERRFHIRWHHATGINFLYVMTNSNNARPIGDWRFDLQASEISQDLKKLSVYEMSSIYINDGGTYSFPLALAGENERINVYFWKDKIEVRWFDYSGRGNEQSESIPIPETTINSSWVVQTIKEHVDLMRRNRPHG